MILKKSFYNRNTLQVAQGLLGCILVRKIGKKIIRAVITETEAYMGEDDLASHASRGRTPRTELMYGEAGHAYVYMIYGMYHCLNVVTEKNNFPAAVLIRGIEIINDSPLKKGRCPKDRGIYETKKIFQIPPSPPFPKGEINLDGPGKLCKFLEIDRKLNGWDMTKGEKIWIEHKKPSFAKATAGKVKKAKRIGIDYAQHCKEYLWRFNLDTSIDKK